MTKQIGSFSEKVINLLQLDIETDTPIYIGDSNIEHIKNVIRMNTKLIFPTSKILLQILIM